MNSAQQQPVRVRVLFFFLELRVHLCAFHSVHNSLLLHLANRASFTCKTDSFSWGHGPDALACKARPSSDQCGTSMSVSLSAVAVARFIMYEFRLIVARCSVHTGLERSCLGCDCTPVCGVSGSSSGVRARNRTGGAKLGSAVVRDQPEKLRTSQKQFRQLLGGVARTEAGAHEDPSKRPALLPMALHFPEGFSWDQHLATFVFEGKVRSPSIGLVVRPSHLLKCVK